MDHRGFIMHNTDANSDMDHRGFNMHNTDANSDMDHMGINTCMQTLMWTTET